MKRRILAICAFLAMAALMGCGNKDAAPQSTAKPTSEKASMKPAEAMLNNPNFSEEQKEMIRKSMNYKPQGK